MDAFPTAADMLIEIKTESLQHLLMTIRQKTAPVGATYIPKLDAILSAQEQQSSCPASSIDRGDVLEIQGPAASGKSQLLYHLVITCIMPSRYQSVNIGGWDKAAVLFDNDGTFHIESFHSILLSRLTSLIPDRYRVRTPNSVRLVLVRSPSFQSLSVVLLPLLVSWCPRTVYSRYVVLWVGVSCLSIVSKVAKYVFARFVLDPATIYDVPWTTMNMSASTE